jgi:hypothetical protein
MDARTCASGAPSVAPQSSAPRPPPPIDSSEAAADWSHAKLAYPGAWDGYEPPAFVMPAAVPLPYLLPAILRGLAAAVVGFFLPAVLRGIPSIAMAYVRWLNGPEA